MMNVPGIVSKILKLNQLDVDCNIQFLEPDLTRRE